MKQESVIKALGYNLSATVLSIAGATGKKPAEKFLVSLPNRGQTTWKGQKEQRGQPAFDLAYLPGLFLDALRLIMAQGFDISPDGVISGSVRPYDLVIANTNGVPLMPALSGQCDAATEEVKWLKDQGAEEIVGRLEPQMALPKLLWALKKHPALKKEIGTVMFTGDWVAMQLAGNQTLSSSEALSNGLLVKSTGHLAEEIISSTPGLSPFWFPSIIQSGRLIPRRVNTVFQTPDWDAVRALLPGWNVVAGSDDYQAGGEPYTSLNKAMKNLCPAREI